MATSEQQQALDRVKEWARAQVDRPYQWGGIVSLADSMVFDPPVPCPPDALERAGETAGQRFERLCDEHGITLPADGEWHFFSVTLDGLSDGPALNTDDSGGGARLDDLLDNIDQLLAE